MVNLGTKIGYQRWVELDEFMCGIDGRVVKEVPKREARDVDRLGSGCSGTDSPAVSAVGGDVAAIATRFTAAVLMLANVLRWSLSRSQTG